MRFLADENFPSASVNRLRESGHDVAFVVEDSPGMEDAGVMARAAEERRVLLTFDRDYGELIYRFELPSPAGIVYFRLTSAAPEEPAERLLRLLDARGFTLEGKFTVMERERARQTPLPRA